jgi:hypothetical protein
MYLEGFELSDVSNECPVYNKAIVRETLLLKQPVDDWSVVMSERIGLLHAAELK